MRSSRRSLTPVTRGRGGAGFMRGKMHIVLIPKEKKGNHYLAVNADESEPGTFKDRYLMDFDPHSLLEGIAITCIATRCDIAYIFIRGEYHRQAEALEFALKEAYAQGVFGSKGSFGSQYKIECYVHRGAGAYICGEETGLLESSLEGKRGWPRNFRRYLRDRGRICQADRRQQCRNPLLCTANHRKGPRVV